MERRTTCCVSYRRLAAMSLVFLALVAAACGPKTNTGGSDPNKVKQLVGSLADSSDNPQMVSPVFAQGCVPTLEKCRQFQRYSLWAKTAEISGDTATLIVDVQDARTGKALPNLTWTAVKENGEWKLKETPLP
ncbi:MAG: hypothetical protein U9N87_05580 [Planctomycetota bacterium]|nr:hypothetical protein [Planctomycetota bacterium]